MGTFYKKTNGHRGPPRVRDSFAIIKNMTKDELLNGLIKDGYLKTPAVIEAFKAVDRKDFLPEEIKDQAYINEALPIGYQQTISQPLVVAFMLELLELKPGEKVLDIGTGSGWKAALMARLVGETGKVVSIERISELHDFAKQNIAKYGFVSNGIAKLVLGDGSRGYKKEAPYDKIVAAAAADTLPEAWKDQLKIGGRIVAPVGHSIFVLDKISKEKFQIKEHLGFSFVPLIR